MLDKHLSILLIEDNLYDVRFLRRALMREPLIDLEHVESLEEALKRLERGGIDIALLDLSLPDGYGLETFDRLYERFPSLPVVVLTGYNDEDLAMRTLRRGAQDYLVKGLVDSNSLVRSIRYAIERKRAEQEQLASQKELRELEVNLEQMKEELQGIQELLLTGNGSPQEKLLHEVQFLADKIEVAIRCVHRFLKNDVRDQC